jgi:type IV secretory pathway TraG/TraD family ATPase VirD4
LSVSIWVGLALALFSIMMMQQLRGTRHRDIYRRGARIQPDTNRFRPRHWRSARASASLSLAGAPILPIDETKHFKLIGTTGTGKSTAIRELLTCALDRGDRAVISDPDGAYTRQFVRAYRGDAILNPFERDSLRWDPLGELITPYDADLLASALIPVSTDPASQEWRGYGRTFVAALMRRAHAQGGHCVQDLWRLMAVAPVEELRVLLTGTPAQPFLEPENAKMFGSIRAVAVSAMAALEHIQGQRAADFSIRQWVRAGRGVLFLPYQASQIAALRSAIAAWLRLAIFEALSQPDGRDQRLWFVIDELDALGAIDGLKDALARLRKFGGRCVLGFQSIAQVSSTYGQGEAQTLIENCGNTLILRCSGSEQGGTSQFASRLIGEREVVRRQISRGRDADGPLNFRSRRSLQINEQQLCEIAVMPSQIEQLPDLSGYLKTASSSTWQRVRLRLPA